MTTETFFKALEKFVNAGLDFADEWGDNENGIDPGLPENLTPPMSLDEWLVELRHYFNKVLSVDDMESRYWWQHLDSYNKMDAVNSLYDGKLVGLVDEKRAGIIAYIIVGNEDEIVSSLNKDVIDDSNENNL